MLLCIGLIISFDVVNSKLLVVSMRIKSTYWASGLTKVQRWPDQNGVMLLERFAVCFVVMFLNLQLWFNSQNYSHYLFSYVIEHEFVISWLLILYVFQSLNRQWFWFLFVVLILSNSFEHYFVYCVDCFTTSSVVTTKIFVCMQVELNKEDFQLPPGWRWDTDWYISPELR